MPGVFGTLLGLRNVTQGTNWSDAERSGALRAWDSSGGPQDHELCNPLIRGARLNLGRSTQGG